MIVGVCLDDGEDIRPGELAELPVIFAEARPGNQRRIPVAHGAVP